MVEGLMWNVPSDNKPLPETMLAKIYAAMWLSLSFTYFLIAREMVNDTMLTNVTADICAYLIHNGSTSCDFSATWAFVATYVDIESGEGQAGVRKKMMLRHGLFCGEPLLIDGFSLRVFVMSCSFLMLCYLILRMTGQPGNFSLKYLVFRSHTARNQPWHQWSNSKPNSFKCCYYDAYGLINQLVRTLINQLIDWLIYRFVRSFRSIRSKWWLLVMASWHLWSSSSAFWWGLERPVQP